MSNAGLGDVMAREEANRRRALGLNKEPTIWQYLKQHERALAEQRAEIQHLKAGLETLTVQLAQTNQQLQTEQQ